MKLLDISENKICDEGATALSNCIHLINKVEMTGCDITNVGIESIANALESCNHKVGGKLKLVEYYVEVL